MEALAPPLAGRIVEALMEQAVALQRDGRLDEAAPIYEAILENDPDHPGAANNLSVVLRRHGRGIEALALLERVIAAHPGLAALRLSLANLYRALGRMDEARESYERTLVLDPASIHALLGLAELMLSAGDDASAARLLDRAGHADPGHAGTAALHGEILLRAGRAAEAADAFARALAREPDLVAARRGLGVALSRLVPQRLFRLLEDAAFVRAAAGAVARAARGRTILDLWSAGGLLAIAGLRAGAAQALVVEPNRWLADAITEAATANGVGERLAVMPRLGPGPSAGGAGAGEGDPGGRVGLLIAAALPDPFPTPASVAALARVVADRLAAEGRTVPAAAVVRAVAVECPRRRRAADLDDVAGLRLGALSVFRDGAARSVDLSAGDCLALGDPVAVATVDFSRPALPEPATVAFVPRRAGTVHAIAWWLDLVLDEVATARGRTPDSANHLGQRLQLLERDGAAEAGVALAFTLRFDERGPAFAWAAPEPALPDRAAPMTGEDMPSESETGPVGDDDLP